MIFCGMIDGNERPYRMKREKYLIAGYGNMEERTNLMVYKFKCLGLLYLEAS